MKTPKAPTVRIGCAGWAIPSAHAARFPGTGSHLERYARVFDAVEINSSFYRPHRPGTYARWADSVPETFRFAVKMPKAISHERRLRGCGELLGAFLDEVTCLGDRLGVLLLQLPPSLAFDAATALPFFDLVRSHFGGALACEPRHASWFTPAMDQALRARAISRVAADPAPVPRAAVPSGARGLDYLRLHGSPHVYYDAYSDASLQRVARALRRPLPGARERWCIFDNTALGHATDDALKLKALLD